jgi:hypothetical protein
VNFVNSAEEDGLAAAYRASAELQNTTVNGVNYRCEVGYKHQQQPRAKAADSSHSLTSNGAVVKTDSDSVSNSMGGVSLNTSGNASASVSNSSQPHQVVHGSQQAQQQRGFLPTLSPRHFAYSNSSVNSTGLSQSPSHSHSHNSHSHSSSGPPSPHPAHPAAYYGVNPQVMSSGASVISQGSGSTGMYTTSSPYPQGSHSPHGHHPVSAIVSYVPTAAVPMQPMYQPQGVQPQQGMYVQAPHQQQMPYYPPQAGQQGYYVQQPAQGYYASGYAPQQLPTSPYYGSNHSQQSGYYAPSAAPSQDGYFTAAPPQQAEGYGTQYYAGQGYYNTAAPVPTAPAGPVTSPRPPAATYEAPHLTEQMLSQHGRSRRPGMVPQQPHMPPPMYAQPMQVPDVVDGRRSQRNISNKSNISEITSATLNELQCDEDDEVDDEEVPQPAPAVRTALPPRHSVPSADATNELASAVSRHLKSTLQTQADTAPLAINCKLTARRGKRSVSGGSNATEITAAVLYDLQQQEQRLEKEEEEEGFTEPPNTRTQRDAPHSASPTTAVPAAATAFPRQLTTTPVHEPASEALAISTEPDAESEAVLSPADLQALSPVSVVKMLRTPARRRPSSAEAASAAMTASSESTPSKSISPFSLTADALEQLQREAEAQDAASRLGPQRRSKRNISDRSNASDITAALAYMQVEYSEDHFKSLDDDGESYSSASQNACVCGKSAASCPFGTTACSCVYSATC